MVQSHSVAGNCVDRQNDKLISCSCSARIPSRSAICRLLIYCQHRHLHVCMQT